MSGGTTSGLLTSSSSIIINNVYYYYIGWFIILLIVLLLFRRISGLNNSDNNANNSNNPTNNNKIVSGEFKRFQRIYIIVYLIMMAADWLQGAYVYALYASYGYKMNDIAILFVVGFGSSLVFGTIVG
jgi:hypothetical protein